MTQEDQNNQNQGNQDQNQDQKQNQGNEDDKGQGQGQEAKFTQDDLNKFAAKIRAEEKAKADKLQADLKRQQELAAMQETDRLKAEKEDAENKLKEMQEKIAYNEARNQAISGLAEAKLDNRLIDVLMSDKTPEEKIKLMATVQKEVVDKAIKDAMPSHNPGSGKGQDTKSPLEAKEYKYGFEKFK